MGLFIIPNKLASISPISETINQGIVKIANLRYPAKNLNVELVRGYPYRNRN